MSVGLSSLTVNVGSAFSWTAQQAINGADYQPVTNSGNISPGLRYSNSILNNALGGADQIISYILPIAASGTATIDLTSLTNILQQTGITLARVKAYEFRLLSLTDDPENGTACTSITWGNAATNSQQLNLPASMTSSIFNGGVTPYWDETATGFVVDGTHKSVKFVNNDGAHGAGIQITFIGGVN